MPKGVYKKSQEQKDKMSKAHSKYKKVYSRKRLKDYLKSRQDDFVTVVKKTTKKGGKVFTTKFEVRLPTIEGYADFLKVSNKTLYNWAEDIPEFARVLEKINNEQKKRLLDMGLAGYYNPTIAKLILSSNHGMRENIDATSGGKPINAFNDEQIDRIAERIAGRKESDGTASSTKKSD
jgi:hypothetical protein